LRPRLADEPGTVLSILFARVPVLVRHRARLAAAQHVAAHHRRGVGLVDPPPTRSEHAHAAVDGGALRADRARHALALLVVAPRPGGGRRGAASQGAVLESHVLAGADGAVFRDLDRAVVAPERMVARAGPHRGRDALAK